MSECYFCKAISEQRGLSFIQDLDLGMFVASWDEFPVTPGHAILFPKRHAQFMKDLNNDEGATLTAEVLKLKNYILGADLPDVYKGLLERLAGTKSEAFVRRALDQVQRANRPPAAFNDGLNDGPAAGQTVPHFHWHVMPRWSGDVEDPRGGIRHMFPGLGNYHEDIKQA